MRGQCAAGFARSDNRINRSWYSRCLDDDLAVVTIGGIQITRAEIQTNGRVIVNSAGDIFGEIAEIPAVRDRKRLRWPSPAKEIICCLPFCAESQDENRFVFELL